MRVVPQIGCMGCAVSAVAAVTGRTYAQALRLFSDPDRQHGRGFGKRTVLDALGRAKLPYRAKRFSTANPRGELDEMPQGAIVFVRRERADRYGHYLAYDGSAWLDSLDPTSAGQKRTGKKKPLRGAPTWAPQKTGARWRALPASYRPEGLYLIPSAD